MHVLLTKQQLCFILWNAQKGQRRQQQEEEHSTVAPPPSPLLLLLCCCSSTAAVLLLLCYSHHRGLRCVPTVQIHRSYTCGYTSDTVAGEKSAGCFSFENTQKRESSSSSSSNSSNNTPPSRRRCRCRFTIELCLWYQLCPTKYTSDVGRQKCGLF